MRKKNILSTILAVALTVTSVLGGSVAAPGMVVNAEELKAHESSNIGRHEYFYGQHYWAVTTTSYLVPENDGGYTRVENETSVGEITFAKCVYAEKYDKDFNLISSTKVLKELEYFLGFYSGSTYNFIVFGQENLEASDDVEVLRIVKYDKNWKRISSLSIHGANTVSTLTSAMQIREYENLLFIRTGHAMYYSNYDGVAHQRSMSLTINTETMTLKESTASNGIGIQPSHSYNQLLEIKDGRVYTADQGDSSHRGILAVQQPNSAGITMMGGLTIDGYPEQYAIKSNMFLQTPVSTTIEKIIQEQH